MAWDGVVDSHFGNFGCVMRFHNTNGVPTRNGLNGVPLPFLLRFRTTDAPIVQHSADESFEKPETNAHNIRQLLKI
jgi:hypothetical protein